MDIITSPNGRIYARVYNPSKNKVESIFTGIYSDQADAFKRLEEFKKMIEGVITGKTIDKKKNVA